MIREMDTDHSGMISADEFLRSYDHRVGMKELLTVLHIDREDLGMLFDAMDVDATGALAYTEIVRYIEKSQSQDLRVQMEVMKMEIRRMGKHVTKCVLDSPSFLSLSQ